MTKSTLNRIKKEWTPHVPISLVMVLVFHYLTYKILDIYSKMTLSFNNIYSYAEFWGIDKLSSDSLIIHILAIYILLICYCLIEARSDWKLFPKFRTVTIYGITVFIAIQGIIGLDIMRRLSPYNPDQFNRTNDLQDAIMHNDLREVKRLIAIGYDPFDYSIGSKKLLDDYKWLIPSYWEDNFEGSDKDSLPRMKKKSIFYFASMRGIKGASRWDKFIRREDFLHPYQPETFPEFDPTIFDFLFTLNPSKQYLQYALEDMTLLGNTKGLKKILEFDPSLIPYLHTIDNSINFCYADVSEILLEHFFKNSTDPAESYRQLFYELGHYKANYSPCTAPVRKYLEEMSELITLE